MLLSHQNIFGRAFTLTHQKDDTLHYHCNSVIVGGRYFMILHVDCICTPDLMPIAPFIYIWALLYSPVTNFISRHSLLSDWTFLGFLIFSEALLMHCLLCLRDHIIFSDVLVFVSFNDRWGLFTSVNQVTSFSSVSPPSPLSFFLSQALWHRIQEPMDHKNSFDIFYLLKINYF